jgi:hypothetical protein
MPNAEDKYFECLKKDISEKLRATYPGIDPDVTHWKGDDIARFQEDLIRIVNGRISEKWFYMHIKNANGHLPRIDILNLLSRYIGFEDWSSYKASRNKDCSVSGSKRPATIKIMYFVSAVVLIVFSVIYLLTSAAPKTYSFCFINALSKEPLRSNDVEVIVLNDTESPYRINPNQSGCINFTVKDGSIRFVVKGAYYKTDTIMRKFNKQTSNEVIPVRVNDYALMLHMFSQGNILDWEKRRVQLNNMFSEDAQIFQLMEGQVIGMEMYNKEEFINKLTMPLSSLRNIEIIETIFDGKRIKELRFKQVNK